MCRNYSTEGSQAGHTTVFEPMVMSIILSQRLRITVMEKELALMLPTQPAHEIHQEEKKPSTEKQNAVAISNKQKPAGGEQTRLS